MTDQPLAGIRVLDFTTLLPGPLATLMLAEAGAEVIKIERPGGEDLRFYPPFIDGVSAPFALLNRGKRSLELDLKAPDVLDRLLPLVRQADILVEQFRPGVMERLGLGYEALSALNPGLIYCSITGYGQEGERALEAGHDVNYMALTGLLALSCGAGDHAVLPPTQIADIGGGSFPAFANILLALIGRQKSGRGTRLDIAMADAMFTFALFAHSQVVASGKAPANGSALLTGGSPRYRLYPAKDGGLIAVGALEQKFWDGFCRVIGLEEALRDDRRNPQETMKAVASLIASRTAAEWAPLLAAADCCATPVRPLHEAMADPHFAGRGLFDHALDGFATPVPAAVVPIAPQFRPSPTAKSAPPLASKDDALISAAKDPA